MISSISFIKRVEYEGKETFIHSCDLTLFNYYNNKRNKLTPIEQEEWKTFMEKAIKKGLKILETFFVMGRKELEDYKKIL